MVNAAPTGGYGTQTDEMQRAGTHVFTVNESIQGELRTLRARLEPLAGAWRGEAATQFAALMVRWDADATSLNEALMGIGQAIQASGQSYQQNETTQQGAFSTITSALG